MRTDVEVPENLSALSPRELKALRDRLIAAGCKAGGIDDRLKAVAEALKRKGKKRPKKEDAPAARKPKRKRDGKFQFGSLGSVAGDKLAKLRGKPRDG